MSEVSREATNDPLLNDWLRGGWGLGADNGAGGQALEQVTSEKPPLRVNSEMALVNPTGLPQDHSYRAELGF